MKSLTTGLFIMMMAVYTAGAFAGNIRHPIWAGNFYPEEEQELNRVIVTLRQNADQEVLSPFSGKPLKALIMPHASYIYSGQTASYATFLLDESAFGKVIMIGPDHTTGFSESVVICADYWRTPLGLTEVHGDAKKLAKRFSFFTPVTDSFLNEHSLEVILPFLQYSLNHFSIVPVVAGKLDIDDATEAIESIIDDDTLIVASSGLSHNLSYSDAIKQDAETINHILHFEIQELLEGGENVCGRFPVGILMTIARKRGWRPELVHYSNSADALGDKSHVVGYCTIAFFDEGDHQED